MKYGLLVTSPISSYKNIGDYIQSLAAKQYINGNCCFVEKEKISEFSSDEEVKVIMNAWYMWHPENWPPKPCINPLLISMHISPLTADRMLSQKGKEYLIKYGPVGCRDLGTKKILDDANIPCYFSACLTLTLGRTYGFKGNRDGAIFVDPYIPPIRYVINGRFVYHPLNLLKSIGYYVKNIGKVNKLVSEKHFFKSRIKLLTYYNASMFYHVYSSRFSDDILFSAEYLTHMIPVDEIDNNDSLLAKAERLIMKYARCQLVVTSRIHCALPCIGLETPVIFVLNKDMESEHNMFNAPNRFGGLIDFFRVMMYNQNKLYSEDEEIKRYNTISMKTILSNKNGWKKYYDSLVDECFKFL